MKTGLFIGRFQPFHLGHLSAIKQALAQVDFLVIGIGSSQYSRTEENPFTFKERKQMIEETLKEEGITAFEIKAIPDIQDDARWPAHVRSLTGNFDILFTGSNNTKELFKKYDQVAIQSVKFEIKISGTTIRQLIHTKGDWQKNLPSETVKIIQAAKGVGGAGGRKRNPKSNGSEVAAKGTQ